MMARTCASSPANAAWSSDIVGALTPAVVLGPGATGSGIFVGSSMEGPCRSHVREGLTPPIRRCGRRELCCERRSGRARRRNDRCRQCFEFKDALRTK
eukprot:1205683-Prymnesium_polylepis.1